MNGRPFWPIRPENLGEFVFVDPVLLSMNSYFFKCPHLGLFNCGAYVLSPFLHLLNEIISQLLNDRCQRSHFMIVERSYETNDVWWSLKQKVQRSSSGSFNDCVESSFLTHHVYRSLNYRFQRLQNNPSTTHSHHRTIIFIDLISRSFNDCF